MEQKEDTNRKERTENAMETICNVTRTYYFSGYLEEGF